MVRAEETTIFDARQYWNWRYASGPGGGSGSRGRQRDFKLKRLKKITEVESVLDVGCGNFVMGAQFMELFPEATYLGLDISKIIIGKNRKKQLGDRFKFKLLANSRFNYPSDLVVCFDVLYHIIEDSDYQEMLESLKKSWKKHLFITYYTPESIKMGSKQPYIKKRMFDPNYFSESHYKVAVPLYGIGQSPNSTTFLYRFDRKWTCPICRFQGAFELARKKNKWHHTNYWCCPNCLSKNQHRLIWLAYEQIQKELIGRKMLHCSPNIALKEKFAQQFDYLSMDFPPREGKSGIAKADLNQDLRDICFKDEYFDIIICSNVLDQIKEDEKAIDELHRILKSTGVAFIVIAMYPREKTRRLSKQVLGHWWRCGYDYLEKLRKAGFSIKLIKYDQFENWEEFGLDGEVLALCRKKGKKAKKRLK